MADVADIFDKVGPTLQFASEVGFGTLGLIGGGITGGIPGAITGGGGGTALGGTLSYAARAGTSELFNGPPLNVEKATKDLAISSGFGAIPLGAPAKSFGVFAENIIKRFPGAEGRTALQDIVESGGKTADEKNSLCTR